MTPEGVRWWKGRTDSRMSLETDNHGALDEGGARVVDAVKHRLQAGVSNGKATRAGMTESVPSIESSCKLGAAA